jgi:hypothetical protein
MGKLNGKVETDEEKAQRLLKGAPNSPLTPTAQTSPIQDATVADAERKKLFEAQFKEFAADPSKSPNTWAGLSAEGAKLGLTQEQLRKPLSFNQQEGLARQDSAASGAFGGKNENPSISAGPTTRLLDRYDALQGSQMGSTSALRQGPKSLESDTGRAMRMARKLQRSGFGRAAEQIALTGGETGLKEPTLKSQDYASGVQAKNDASLAAAQSFQTGMEEEAKLRRDLLKAQLESFRNTNPKPL